MLQIAKVQNAAAALQRSIVCAKLPHQPHQPLRRTGRGTQIRNHLAGIIGKAPGSAFQLCLAGISDGLNLLGQHRVVFFSRKSQLSKVNILPGIHVIPGFAVAQIFQLLHQCPNVGNWLFHPFIPFQAAQKLPLHANLHIQPVKKGVHQRLSPDGISGIGHPIQFHIVKAVVQPLLGILVATGCTVYLQDNVGNGTVIPPHPLRIHKFPEMIAFTTIFVGSLHQILQNRFPEVGTFRLLCHSKIRGQIHPISVLPQNRGAKTMNC